MASKLFAQIGISLLLGLLIGLQRERAESTIGGIRTFPLIAAFGTMCGWLAADHGGWNRCGGPCRDYRGPHFAQVVPAFGAAMLVGVGLLWRWPTG